MRSMRAYLEQAGFRKTGYCTCGGTPTEHWQLPGIPVIWIDVKPVRDFFKVKSVKPPITGSSRDIVVKVEQLKKDLGLVR